MAQRIAQEIEIIEGVKVKVGMLDITYIVMTFLPWGIIRSYMELILILI